MEESPCLRSSAHLWSQTMHGDDCVGLKATQKSNFVSFQWCSPYIFSPHLESHRIIAVPWDVRQHLRLVNPSHMNFCLGSNTGCTFHLHDPLERVDFSFSIWFIQGVFSSWDYQIDLGPSQVLGLTLSIDTQLFHAIGLGSYNYQAVWLMPYAKPDCWGLHLEWWENGGSDDMNYCSY